MSVLVDLPSVIVCDILQNWIDVRCWSVIDSSFCSKRLRSNFSSELAGLTIESDIVSRYCTSIRLLRWLYLRNVRVHSMVFQSFHFKGRKLKFDIDYSNLQSITVSGAVISQSLFVSVINRCSSLRTLNCSGFCVFNRIKPKILNGLCELNLSPLIDGIESNQSMTKDTVEMIASHCRSLSSLHLFCRANADDQIHHVVQNCTLLRSFSVVGNSPLDNFPCTWYLHMDDVSIHNEKDCASIVIRFVEMIEAKPSIRRLVVQNDLSKFCYENVDHCRILDLQSRTSTIELNDIVASVSEVTAFYLTWHCNDEHLDGICDLLYNHSAATLRDLRVNGYCLGIERLVRNCTKLTELHIIIDVDSEFESFIDLTNDLTVLVVKGVCSATELSILLQNCKQLQRLESCTVYLDHDHLLEDVKGYRNDSGGTLKLRATIRDKQGDVFLWVYDGEHFTVTLLDQEEEENEWVVEGDSDYSE